MGPVDDTIVHGKVGKNRSGKANISVDFNVNFELFKFISASTKSNPKKPDDTGGGGCNMNFGGGVDTI